MWMSKKITSNKENKENISLGEVTQVNGNRVNVQNSEEYRDIPLLAPYGISYLPLIQSEMVVLNTSNGSYCLGNTVQDMNLNPGEIMLYSSGGASLVLKNDGTVLVNGKAVLTEE